ncbi:xylose isomerase [Deminuibacter soli]|uniref:Xylose isomerase n=2 Tax=Deminuibacter soli TaxID=2291815 RepID=A0A3E1NF94_9BACT|nr:xylose isomerase [Deminuibacter soli]
MQRKDFIRNSLLTGGAMVAGKLTASASAANTTTPAEGTPFHLNYGVHDGMFKEQAGKEYTDQLKFAYDLGFRAMEDNGFVNRPVDQQEKIGNTMAKLGMQMGVFVVDKGGNGANTLAAGKQEYIDIFLKGCRQAVEAAKRINATWVTVVPGDFYNRLPLDVQTANVISALRQGAAILEPHKLVMVLEPLSDTPDLFLRTSAQTYMICKAVNSPSCKILFDMYHMQRNEGDIINHINQTWDEIAYFQIGDNPGRKEPGTGEVNYKNIFKHLYNKGYKGVLGMEHGISGKGVDGEKALVAAYRDADNFM